MCQFSWSATVVVLPHKSPESQVYRSENIALGPKSYRKRACVRGQVASLPTPVKHAAVVELEKCDPAEENGKRIHNNRAGASSPRRRMRRRSGNQRRVMRWSALLAQLPSLGLPSSSSSFAKLLSLVFFFLSPPCSVLFRSDFLALAAAERKGEERGQLMEKIWGK